jgi:hypothetical protein
MTSTAPAGWYPDPSGVPGQRWWDGQAWSTAVAPLAAHPVVAATVPAGPIGGTTVLANAPYASSVYPYQPTRVPAGIGVQSGNRLALITFAVVAVYLFIALESKIVIFGVLPLGLSLRSKRQGEPLAPFAIGAAVLAILVAAVRLLGH